MIDQTKIQLLKEEPILFTKIIEEKKVSSEEWKIGSWLNCWYLIRTQGLSLQRAEREDSGWVYTVPNSLCAFPTYADRTVCYQESYCIHKVEDNNVENFRVCFSRIYYNGYSWGIVKWLQFRDMYNSWVNSLSPESNGPKNHLAQVHYISLF